MKKFTSIFLYSCTAMAIVLNIGLSSCGSDDDKEPEAKAQLSFSVAEKTVNEADGTVEIEVTLDKAAPEDFTIEYEWSGTAYEKASPHPTTGAYDYEILEDAGELEMEEGETTAIIQIKFYSDLAWEDSETINLSIEDIDTDLVELTRDDEIDITLEQEDGMIVSLQWGVADGENYTDVDMDFYLWAENDASTLQITDISGSSGFKVSPETIIIPHTIIVDGNYGASYNYYEGSEEPMNFRVVYAELIDGELEPEADWNTFTASYTLANLNPYLETGVAPLLAQTFDIENGDYTNFSEIAVSTSGSRVNSGTKLPDNLKRERPMSSSNNNTLLRQLLKK
jgi:hypothetical protein